MSRPLTYEDVGTYPLPGMAVPSRVEFSPSGEHLTYLFSGAGSLVQSLYAKPIAGGPAVVCVTPPGTGDTEEGLSLEEKLRRERLRERGLGVTRYGWAKRADRLCVPISGAVYVQDGVSAPLRAVVPKAEQPALDPRLSPDGAWLAFVRESELYVVSAEGGEPAQITSGARGTGKTNGLADYIAEEEMHRHAGYWWSDDGQQLAFTEVDETHIPAYRILHQGKDAVGPSAEEDHRYPFAGAANPRVRLGVVARTGGDVRWLDLGEYEYLARVQWLPDGRLLTQTQDRAQQELRLSAFDLASGERQDLLTETNPIWINLHDALRPIGEGAGVPEAARGGFLWASEASGFLHLSLRGPDGALIRDLTSGEWQVDGVAGVDPEGGWVYFTATEADVRQQQLYAVSLSGGEPRRVTQGTGIHTVRVDAERGRFVDLHHSLEQPPRLSLRSLSDDGELAVLHEGSSADPRVGELGLRPPRLVTLEAHDGTELHAALYEPDGEGPFPTIVNVYGGPGPQRVQDSWGLSVDLRSQLLRERGFLVIRLDNRGSARRGLAFEGAIRHEMGDLEIKDQVAGIEWLASQGLTDPARVGIYGWSYGGYLSAMALARAPEVFRAGVAGAPVTHWDGYDTHYTERYMGTPQLNPGGYERSSVMHHVEGIKGALLLIHGLIDENVHFRHTARLINALIRARKPYEFLLFPDERHMPRGLPDRIYLEERIAEFFARELAYSS
ncbi:MAG: S9 family peptidase [Planctomycetes bacterium]|nr:S9 family peptidase [Planctomycetota bacterium]